jgi:diguanylate cyclase (GGDEF)-like protein
VAERIPTLLRLVVPFDDVELEAADPKALQAALAGEAELPPRGGTFAGGWVIQLPLVAHRIELGRLTVRRRDGAPFDRDETDALATFAGLAAVALHGAHVRTELRRLAYTDSLTGLGNRRALEAELERVDGMLPLSLLLLDFDGLKTANDVLGYAAGDRLIVESARVLAAHVGPGELAARLGGDEFVAVLPGVPEDAALARAARIGAAVDAVAFPPDLAALFQGASHGAVGARPGERPAELLLRAARDMHHRKAERKTGRAVA